jgi:beta-lactamase regulating signal transducer with metallopeptidase domain
MIWPRVFEPEVSSRICWTLLHSFWQVAAAALIAELASRRRKTSTEWSYLVHAGALIFSLLAVPTTFVLLSSSQVLPMAAVTTPRVAQPDFDSVSSKTTTGVLQPQHFAAPSDHTPVPGRQALNAVASPDFSAFTADRAPFWQQAAQLLAVLYAAGVGVMLVRLAVGLAQTDRLRRTATVLQHGPAFDGLKRIVGSWKLRSAPILATAERIVVPTVVGLVRPVILLPASALSGLGPSELELILAHELAHIRRFDMWVNLAQRIAEAAYFFNPALWYLSRRISALREYCCDEWACSGRTQTSATIRSEYASALLHVVELARLAPARRSKLIGLAADGRSPSELRRRIARLIGEPLREPFRVSRGGLCAVSAIALALSVGPVWLRSQEPAVTEKTTAAAADYPPPPTKADILVAGARARTFGIQGLPRISIRQTYWNADVLAMKKVHETSFEKLWQARGQDVDEAMRRNTNMKFTLAWDGPQLLVETKTRWDDKVKNQNAFFQSRLWNGSDGWITEMHSQGRNLYRYNDIDKLFEHIEAFALPHWTAAGASVPWNGQRVVIDEYSVDPKLTRYEHSGTATIDGVLCDIYDGPARQERVWIEKPTGLVKAVSRSYVHAAVRNYETELVREVTGRKFANADEYWAWNKKQPKEIQEKLSAHWEAANWKGSEPGNLSVFSDYREIAPGVRWPMKCERIIVQPNGNNKSAGYTYYRGEVIVQNVSKEFSIRELAKDTLPKQGDNVSDRRFNPEINYAWGDSLKESEIENIYKAKLQQKMDAEEAERRINDAPINSVADAMHILCEGPKVDPSKIWARAVKYLVDHKQEGLPALIKQLDSEKRDHAISKIAFALRAIGDRRAVPALIRALPRTLLPSRSDFGVRLEDEELCRFMQQNDTEGKIRRGSDLFDYGRAFREVVSALHRLTGKNFGDMELNWVHLSESPVQQAQQRAQFHRLAKRWADWWEANWKTLVEDPAYAKVNLPPLEDATSKFAGRQTPPAGPGVRLQEGPSQWIVQSAHESKKQCFVDLDTMREGGWLASLPPIEKISIDSPELLAWARKQGYDIVGVTAKSPDDGKPIYCLQPLDMHVWKITADEHRHLADAMAGRRAYPLSHPVTLMIPQREVKRPYDNQFGGDSFLFVTREGTAGVIRMTAQVTEVRNLAGYALSDDDQFSSTGFYRGVKINFEAMTEAAPAKQSRRETSDFIRKKP